MEICKASAADFDSIWPVFHTVVAAGTTYPYDPATTKNQARHLWMEIPLATYLAREEGETLGTYYIKPNQPGLGAHICNCGYMVAPDARRQGLGRMLCLHSLDTARELGFLAMQFNLVISTNTVAVRIRQQLGFTRIGTIPQAFNHNEYGLVDAHIMHRQLV
ncbi:MAG TPA: GNAT family N-acetyltransferase [Desulfobulbaceae bacterium]|nr:GNAT family N-acetyltransferase [Desulfobulbaceae bacterium]